jgi:RNA polymerase sigma-70 factor (ECF subfamily)
MSPQSATRAERRACFERELAPLLSGLRASSLRLCRNRSDAEDLLQETVLRAWRFFHHYESGSNCRAWMHRILRNAFVSRYRNGRREAELLAAHGRLERLRVEMHDDAPEAVRCELSAELASGLSALPEAMHAVLWAVAVDELSYREAAQRIGCPIGTVMSRLHRAKDALRPRREGPSPRLPGSVG